MVINPIINIDICSYRQPKLSNLELLAINFTSEYISIDSECQLFRTIKTIYLSDKIERSVYNRRKRFLFSSIEIIRKHIAHTFNALEDMFIADSMSVEVCKNARANRSSICKNELESFPDRGFCASQNTYFYGYKLHGICSISGVFHSIDITPASVHDIHVLNDIKHQLSHCTILGDKGYLSVDYQLNLFESAQIKLEIPMRINQKNYTKYPKIFRKSRKRIETLYSQLCDQFVIRRNYAKSFQGFKPRILSKIASLTIIQYLNKFVFNRPANNLKVNLF